MREAWIGLVNRGGRGQGRGRGVAWIGLVNRGAWTG